MRVSLINLASYSGIVSNRVQQELGQEKLTSVGLTSKLALAQEKIVELSVNHERLTLQVVGDEHLPEVRMLNLDSVKCIWWKDSSPFEWRLS